MAAHHTSVASKPSSGKATQARASRRCASQAWTYPSSARGSRRRLCRRVTRSRTWRRACTSTSFRTFGTPTYVHRPIACTCTDRDWEGAEVRHASWRARRVRQIWVLHARACAWDRAFARWRVERARARASENEIENEREKEREQEEEREGESKSTCAHVCFYTSRVFDKHQCARQSIDILLHTVRLAPTHPPARVAYTCLTCVH